MRDTTPYASFLPLNGYWMVLASRDIDHGDIFANNLRNKPLFIVNGGRDPLYPTRAVDPYVEHYKKGGVSLELQPQPEAGHNTQWWPAVKEAVRERSCATHPRQPLPDALTWETAIRRGAQSRALARHRPPRVGEGRSEALADLNEMAAEPALDFGVRSNGTRINRVVPGSNAERLGLRPRRRPRPAERRNVRGGHRRAEALDDVKPGAHIDLLVARNNQPVELSGIYEPKLVPGRRGSCSRGRCLRPRRSRTRTGNTVRATTRGVAGVHAAAVAGSVRLQQAGDSRRQRPHGVRGPRAEGSHDAR